MSVIQFKVLCVNQLHPSQFQFLFDSSQHVKLTYSVLIHSYTRSWMVCIPVPVAASSCCSSSFQQMMMCLFFQFFQLLICHIQMSFTTPCINLVTPVITAVHRRPYLQMLAFRVTVMFYNMIWLIIDPDLHEYWYIPIEPKLIGSYTRGPTVIMNWV